MSQISPSPAMDALNPTQRAFVRAFLIGRVAKAAAVEAGYAEASAHNTGTRLLRNPKIIAAIREMEADANARAEKTLDDVIAEFTRIAFSGLGRFVSVTSGGEPFVDMSTCTKEDIDLLSEITVEDFVNGRGDDARDVRKIKIKPLDRMKALEMLGKHLGMGNKSQEEIVDRFAQALLEITQRGSAMPIGQGRKP